MLAADTRRLAPPLTAGRLAQAGHERQQVVDDLLALAGKHRIGGAASLRLAPCHTAAPVPLAWDRGSLVWRTGGWVGAGTSCASSSPAPAADGATRTPLRSEREPRLPHARANAGVAAIQMVATTRLAQMTQRAQMSQIVERSRKEHPRAQLGMVRIESLSCLPPPRCLQPELRMFAASC